jgi:chemotaxis protein CheD
MEDLIARMGEWVAAREDGVLSCIGLGSCIGVALVDRRAAVAGLAHVMLPSAPQAEVEQPGKYADLAVPALLETVLGLGAARPRLEAVLVGGAQMFSFGGGSGQDIGARNAAAVAAQLDHARIRIAGSATGGDKGRSVKVHVAGGSVVYREAAGTPVGLLGEAAIAVGAAA